jgi:hypothetical protein
MRANSACDFFSLARIVRTSSGSKTNSRAAFAFPRRISPELLLDQLAKNLLLPRRQIITLPFRIRQQPVNQVARLMPVVDDPCAAPFSFPPPGMSPADLSETTRTLDDDAKLGPKGESRLEFRVILIIEDRGDLPGENRCHKATLAPPSVICVRRTDLS